MATGETNGAFRDMTRYNFISTLSSMNEVPERVEMYFNHTSNVVLTEHWLHLAQFTPFGPGFGNHFIYGPLLLQA